MARDAPRNKERTTDDSRTRSASSQRAFLSSRSSPTPAESRERVVLLRRRRGEGSVLVAAGASPTRIHPRPPRVRAGRRRDCSPGRRRGRRHRSERDPRPASSLALARARAPPSPRRIRDRTLRRSPRRRRTPRSGREERLHLMAVGVDALHHGVEGIAHRGRRRRGLRSGGRGDERAGICERIGDGRRRGGERRRRAGAGWTPALAAAAARRDGVGVGNRRLEEFMARGGRAPRLDERSSTVRLLSSPYLSLKRCGSAAPKRPTDRPELPLALPSSSFRAVEMSWVKLRDVAGSNCSTSVNAFSRDAARTRARAGRCVDCPSPGTPA